MRASCADVPPQPGRAPISRRVLPGARARRRRRARTGAGRTARHRDLGARGQRARVRARDGPLPVGGRAAGARRAELPADPRVLLPRHRAADGGRPVGPGARARGSRRPRRLDRSVHASATRAAGRSACPPGWSPSRPRSGSAGARSRRRCGWSPGAAALRAGATGYHGSLTLLRHGRQVLVVDRLGLEDYVRDVVSAECVASWRAGGPPRTGGRLEVVRAREPPSPRPLRPLPRRPLPELSGAAQGVRLGDARRRRRRTGRCCCTTAASPSPSSRPPTADLTNDTSGPWPPSTLPYLVSRPDPFDEHGPDTVWGPVGIDTAKFDAAFPELPPDLTSVSDRAEPRRAPARRSRSSAPTARR